MEYPSVITSIFRLWHHALPDLLDIVEWLHHYKRICLHIINIRSLQEILYHCSCFVSNDLFFSLHFLIKNHLYTTEFTRLGVNCRSKTSCFSSKTNFTSIASFRFGYLLICLHISLDFNSRFQLSCITLTEILYPKELSLNIILISFNLLRSLY